MAIEQPEIHLHPRLQAEIADVFLDGALGPRKNTFLLETHSEHLLLRIGRGGSGETNERAACPRTYRRCAPRTSPCSYIIP